MPRPCSAPVRSGASGSVSSSSACGRRCRLPGESRSSATGARRLERRIVRPAGDGWYRRVDSEMPLAGIVGGLAQIDQRLGHGEVQPAPLQDAESLVDGLAHQVMGEIEPFVRALGAFAVEQRLDAQRVELMRRFQQARLNDGTG